MTNKTHYAIREGRECNLIVLTWEKCSALVTGHKGARFKGFTSEVAALAWLDLIEVATDTNVIADVFGEHEPPAKKPSFMKRLGHHKDILERGKCLLRKSYWCPKKQIYFKNRCVMRYWGTTIGEDYKPTDDISIPWEV